MAVGVEVLGAVFVLVQVKVDFVAPGPAQYVQAQYDHQGADGHFQAVGHLFRDHGVAPQHHRAHQQQHHAVAKAPGHALAHHLPAVGKGAGQ